MFTTAISVTVGLTIGNFFSKLCTDKDWGRAAERSFFQAVAIGTFVAFRLL